MLSAQPSRGNGYIKQQQQDIDNIIIDTDQPQCSGNFTNDVPTLNLSVTARNLRTLFSVAHDENTDEYVDSDEGSSHYI